MNLATLLRPQLIFPHLKLTNREEIYHLLTEAIHTYEPCCSVEETIQLLKAREELGSIVFPHGIAIPHTRIDTCQSMHIAIATFEEPIKMDDQDIQLVVLIVTPNSQPGLYLKTIGGFSRIATVNENQVYDRLLKADSVEEAISAIAAANIEVEVNLLAKDIMSPATTVQEDATLKELVDIMMVKHVGFMPVVNSTGLYVGEIGNLEILRNGYPDYIFMMQDISFLLNLEPFKEFLKQEKSMSIQPMIQKRKPVYADTSMVEVVFLFLKHHFHHITVVQNDLQVVGVITTKDIIERILRA